MSDEKSSIQSALEYAGISSDNIDIDSLSNTMSLFGITVEQLMKAVSGFMDMLNTITELGKQYAATNRKRTKKHNVCEGSHKSCYITPYRKIAPTARSRLG